MTLTRLGDSATIRAMSEPTEAGIVDAVNAKLQLKEIASAALSVMPEATDAVLVLVAENGAVESVAVGRGDAPDVARLTIALSTAIKNL